VIISVASAGKVRELHRRRDTGPFAPVGVVGPDSRQIQLPVDQRMPAGAGIGQIHRHLGVLDPPGGPGVLALHPNGVGALLEVAGLVHHQHSIDLAEPLDDVPAQVVTDAIGVPFRLPQKVLQAIRRVVTSVLSQRPAAPEQLEPVPSTTDIRILEIQVVNR
jgi:hypothetical protein